jgi:hypothetical protein
MFFHSSNQFTLPACILQDMQKIRKTCIVTEGNGFARRRR